VDKQRQFDRDLEELKKKLIRMASLAETMIDKAIGELVSHDERLAEKVPEYETELNRLQIEIDDQALTLLATQCPVATDLRFIVAATKINGELERIGDLVINITENVHVLAQHPPLKPLIDIPRMADLARQMVRDSLDAFIRGDALQAQSVIMADDQVDALKDQVLRELLTYMIADPHTIERSLALILISRHLERIGDHATNIAEDVIYMIQGRDVRHPKTPKERPPEMET
jgi:phosphate transport system protein